MNIVCVICSDLLEPSSDVYTTPCGHIFHFQCLTKWIERSKTCPQCRVETTRSSIRRIYFNFPNDDSSYLQSHDGHLTEIAKLQSQVHALNFKLTLADREVKDLTVNSNGLCSNIAVLKEKLQHSMESVKQKNSIINALQEQLTYYKALFINVEEHDEKQKEEITRLKMKVEELQSVQDILDVSTSKVDDMIHTSYADISKLQTFVSVLKRELENSIIQKKQMRDKLVAKRNISTKLIQTQSKMRKLTETLRNRTEENEMLQAEILKIRTAVCNCDKTTTVKCLNKSNNHSMESVTTETEFTSNPSIDELLQICEDDDSVMVTDNAENTPQNIKSQGFFSTTISQYRNIKKTRNNATIPLILAKKPTNLFKNLDETIYKKTNLKKKIASSGMTFDGFGGHAKYDKFPKPLQLAPDCLKKRNNLL